MNEHEIEQIKQRLRNLNKRVKRLENFIKDNYTSIKLKAKYEVT